VDQHDPETMTTAERQREVANIIAGGVLRVVRMARARVHACESQAEKDSAACLELLQVEAISVSPKPAG
jgi:hypothetical protein